MKSNDGSQMALTSIDISDSSGSRPSVRAPADEPKVTAVDWLILTLPGVIWGASFLFIAEGLRAVGPNGITFARILVGFATLATLPAARQRLPASEWRGIAILAVLWMAFPLSMFPYAEQRVSSALTGMLNGAVPLFAAIVASVLARRAPSRGIVVGLGVGLVGAVLMAWPSLDEGGSSADGVLLILAALVSYGFAINLARPLQQRNGALPVIWRAQAIALVLTAPLGVPELLQARWEPGPLLSLLALGVLGTGVAYVLITIAAGRVGSTKASATAFLIPPVALVLGVIVRDERVTGMAIMGAAICVAGAWLVNRARSS
jgi:drug/metabolite transporter (DMT)-like permease